MASRGSRRKAKPSAEKSGEPTASIPAARALAPGRAIARIDVRRGQLEIGLGSLTVVMGTLGAMWSDDGALTIGRFLFLYGLGVLGAVAIALGASRIDRRLGGPKGRDPRRWIYGVLAILFGLAHAVVIWKVIPSRLPSAMLHLCTIPTFMLMMGIGTLVSGRFGWWLAVIGGSLVLLSTIFMIVRILASAVFLAGVYGAFGKAASTFAIIAVAVLIEVVALLPICQVRFLMSPRGRTTYGV